MTENKKPVQNKETTKKPELAITRKKSTAIQKTLKKTPKIAPGPTSDLWQAFDNTFARFRSDFEDLLFPTNISSIFPIIPETRVPTVDLEDKDKDFVLKAEMPGFKKDDIEIEVKDDSVSITGTAGWKYDKKGQLYICKERACKTFFRSISLPEEIKVDEVKADLSDGILEVTLPKKAPKQKRKVALK
jgi:HSP20 family protein